MSRDLQRGAAALAEPGTWGWIGLGLGVAALSSAADEPADRWAQRREGEKFWDAVRDAGNGLVGAGLLGSGFAYLAADARLARTALTSLEAAAGSTAIVTGMKYATGRARPVAGLGNDEFEPFEGDRSYGAFPSRHATAIWATVTPYAKEYDMPWLYGAAALTNVARVLGRDHWVSDTVAGGLLGYAVGEVLWRWHRDPEGHAARIVVMPTGMALVWEF